MNASGNSTVTDEDSVEKPAIQVNEGATVHTNDQNKNVENESIGKEQAAGQTQGVANGHFDDCGAGKHSFSQLVVDSEHVYDVCTCCGYTLVKVVDSKGTEIKQTKNTLKEAEDGRWVVDETKEEVVTPTETYLTTKTIPTKTVNGKKVADVDNLSTIIGTDGQVATDGNEGKPVEKEPEIVKPEDDPKPVDRKCKHVFEYYDVHYTTYPDEDVCLGVCKKCGLQIKTQHDWVVVTHLQNQTEYEGKCTKCGCVRETYVAKIEGIGSFATLPEAFDAIHNGETKTATIKLVANEKFDVCDKAVKVLSGETITLDLNGYILAGFASTSKGSALISNNGTLILKDSSDINKDGSGSGKLISGASGTWVWNGVDGDYSGSYGSYAIENKGTLTIESGYYESAATGSAPFTLDNAGIAVISGGYLKARGDAIRHGAYSSTISLSISGNTTIDAGNRSIWIQLPSASGSPNVSLNISGGEFFKGSDQTYVISDYSYGQDYSKTSYVISGGVFHGSIGFCGGTNKTVSPYIEVTGGIVEGYCYSFYGGSDKAGYTTGGTFNSVYGLVDGYMSTYNENGTYTVSKINVGDTFTLDQVKNSFWNYCGYKYENNSFAYCSDGKAASLKYVWTGETDTIETWESHGYYMIPMTSSPNWYYICSVADNLTLHDNGNGTYTVVEIVED